MPLHAVVSFELRWQFINDSWLGWASLEVLTSLNFTRNHFSSPFPPNSSGVLSLSQAFRICMALLIKNQQELCHRFTSEGAKDKKWQKQQTNMRQLMIILWLPKWYKDVSLKKKQVVFEGSFVPSHLRQVSGSTVARLQWCCFPRECCEQGFAQRAKKARGRDTFCWFILAGQPTIPPIGRWYDSRTKTLYFVRTFSRPRMNR